MPAKIAVLLDELADKAEAECLRGSGARHHDHRHLPQACHAPGRDRRASPVTINGIAKGAGMIAPDMATMLAFLFTDAAIEPGALRDCLHPAVDDSFNAITIDGDTSTSDTLLLFATGRAVTARRAA